MGQEEARQGRYRYKNKVRYTDILIYCCTFIPSYHKDESFGRA